MKSLCMEYGNLAASMLGAALALALIAPPLLLTESPCNDAVLLTPGEQALCVAPGWAGRARVVLTPADNTSSYLFAAHPPVSPAAPVHVERFCAAEVPAHAHRHISLALLNASRLAGTVTTSAPATLCLVDTPNYAHLAAGTAYESLRAAENATSFTFTFDFFVASRDDELQRFYVVAHNTGDAAIDANFTTTAEMTQYDVTNAVQTCHGAEKCAFSGVETGMVLLTVAHGNFTAADHASVAMGWSYRFSTSLPWVIVILAVSGAVAIVVIISLILVFRNDNKKRQVPPSASQEPIVDPSTPTDAAAPASSSSSNPVPE